MSDDLAETVRILAKSVAGLEQRLAQTMVGGTVHAIKGDRVQLNLGIEGREPVLTPFIRLGTASGYEGAGVSAYTRPGIGEPMLLLTPGGRVGEHSRAVPWGPVDDFPSPGAAPEEGHVRIVGGVRHHLRPEEIMDRVWDVAGKVRRAAYRMRPGEWITQARNALRQSWIRVIPEEIRNVTPRWVLNSGSISGEADNCRLDWRICEDVRITADGHEKWLELRVKDTVLRLDACNIQLTAGGGDGRVHVESDLLTHRDRNVGRNHTHPHDHDDPGTPIHHNRGAPACAVRHGCSWCPGGRGTAACSQCTGDILDDSQ